MPDKRQQGRWPFSTDTLLGMTASMDSELRELILSMYHYARSKNMGIDDVASHIGYHHRNLQKLCRGQYDGNVAQFTKAIQNWLDSSRQADSMGKLFVPTDTFQQIDELCTLAWQYRTIGAIWGDSQIGKTESLKAIQRRHDPGIVKMVRFPSSGSRMAITHAVAKACGLNPKKGLITTVRDRIFNSIQPTDLFIWDEMHETALTYNRPAQTYAHEFIRDIYDAVECGMVICGTNVGRQEIEDGVLKDILEQLRRRNVFTLQLPKYATLNDINAIGKHFGLPKLPKGTARDLVMSVIKRNGLKAYTIYLQAGQQLAQNRSEKFTWQHVVTAHDLTAKYSKGVKQS